MTKLGELIKRKRKLMGLTHAEVAQKMGVNVGHISLIETGARRNISALILAKLCKALDLSCEQALFTVLADEEKVKRAKV